MIPLSSLLGFVWLCLGRGGGRLRGLIAGVCLFAACTGCSLTSRPLTPARPPAVIEVANHTDSFWRISFQPSWDAESPQWIEIAPRVTRRVELAAGVYHVRRVWLKADAEPADPGRELTFVSGRTYGWPLGTLFSSEGVVR